MGSSEKGKKSCTNREGRTYLGWDKRGAKVHQKAFQENQSSQALECPKTECRGGKNLEVDIFSSSKAIFKGFRGCANPELVL